MHTARHAVRAASLAVLLLVASAGAVFAQAESRAVPPTRAPRSGSPAADYAGRWRSNADSLGGIVIRAGEGSALTVTAPNRFEAAGFAGANLAVTLMRTPPWSGQRDARFDMCMLWIERVDPGTLRVRFSADLHSAATREEIWTMETDAATPGGERNIVVQPPSAQELPKFGEYVYVEELPEAVTKVSPVYPNIAREGGVDGQVLVQVLVGTDGMVKDTKIVKSIPMLDDAAVAAARQWRFKPALSKGQPVAVWVAVPVKFSLH